jgi:NADH:ubiquinone oxidoreductase subunit E
MPRRPVARRQEVEPNGQELDLTPLATIVDESFSSTADLIPVLQRAQAHYGYLPEVLVTEIARLTGVPASRVYGVITFYAQFSTVPKGRHTICVCQGTACHVRGAHDVLRAVEKEVGVQPGETSADLKFSLETVACLGACSFAPVMTIDGQYFAKLKASRAPALIAEVSDGTSREA